MKIKDGRKLSNEALQQLRRDVILYLNEGNTAVAAAAHFGISRRAVEKYKSLYALLGKDGLTMGKRGKPSKPKLGVKEQQHICKCIVDKNPEQLKLKFALWTRDSVADLIWNKYKIKVSANTVGRYLKKWGFTPQKPAYKAYEQCEQEVREWLDKEYPSIKLQAKAQRADIYWGDETGIRSDHHRGRSYSLRGKTPIIKRTGQRFGFNMISALSNLGHLKFMVVDGRINSAVFIVFLKRMIKYKRNKIFLIVDNISFHKTKKVSEWIKANRDRIELFYLPRYSPELNPDEYLNQDLKTNAVGRKSAKSKDELKNDVISFLKNTKSDKEKVKRYFNAEKDQYAS